MSGLGGSRGQGLRDRADVAVRPGVGGDRSLDGWSIVEELRLHQVELELQNGQLRSVERELELQNEQLRAVERELELSRAQYRDLFELAPVGYVCIDTGGVISRGNRAAAGLGAGKVAP
jgi:PAS domain-containing protein